MYVIRLPNGNLLVPSSVTARGGRVVSDAYVEIGPADSDYERLAGGALTEEEMDERRERWRKAMIACACSSSTISPVVVHRETTRTRLVTYIPDR